MKNLFKSFKNFICSNNGKKFLKTLREITVNFALVYSILYALFLIPYLIYINNIFPLIVIQVYLMLLIVYVFVWIYDKREFFKYEFKN